METYQQKIATDRLAIYRGISLSLDDQIRKRIIQEIMCRYQLRYQDIESAYGISFQDYFADALIKLGQLAREGLLIKDQYGFSVTKAGRLFLRHIALAFDRYFGQAESTAKYSPTL